MKSDSFARIFRFDGGWGAVRCRQYPFSKWGAESARKIFVIIALIVAISSALAQSSSALLSAADAGDLARVKELISRGVNVNHRNTVGKTALHKAAFNAHAEMVKVLLLAGANPNIKTRAIYGGKTPLDIARSAGLDDIVAILEAHKKSKSTKPKFVASPASVGETAAAQPPKGANIAEKVFENAWRSIVVIKTADAQGSGVIVRPNIVATNCHVLDGGGEIKIYKHDNRRASTDTIFSATVRKHDSENDFCLLDVSGLWGIPAGIRKYNTLKIGEDVYALGSPKGLDLSLFTGIISQLREGKNRRYIQTDAAISPGSSGGGLFDSDGNLIGILTSKIADEDVEGIGFAIPADLALDL